MNKRGFTLMELMVYIAIVGIVVLVAGQAFTDSSKFRVRSQNMIKASEQANNLATIIREDVEQMGAKSWAAEEDSIVVLDAEDAETVYMSYDAESDDNDLSSFRLAQNGNSTDTLVFRRIHYDSVGQYASTEEVTWYLSDSTLYRKCEAIAEDGTGAASECPEGGLTVKMADHVASFYVIPSKPSVSCDSDTDCDARLFPNSNDTTNHDFNLYSRYDDDFVKLTVTNGSSSTQISGFTPNYDFDEEEILEDGRIASQLYVGENNSSGSDWSNDCFQFDLDTNKLYQVSFKISYSEGILVPGRDHISVGFRTNQGDAVEGLNDLIVYSALDESGNGDGLRVLRFAPRKPASNVCLALTFACYSPNAASTMLLIGSMSVDVVGSSNYVFDETWNNPGTSDKALVRAFRIKLSINQRGETGESVLVAPTPSNGS